MAEKIKPKTILRLLILGFILLVIFLPGFIKLQKMRFKDESLSNQIDQTKKANLELEEEKEKLQNDLAYVEKVAREKMGVVRKGEVIYKVVPKK